VTAGIVLAALAALAYEIGYVLQARGARDAPRVRPGPGLLAALARRPAFLAGSVLGVAGFGLQVLALRHAPLAVVQPILACGLLALLVLARVWLGERPGRRECAGALLVAAGAALALSVAPHLRHGDPSGARYVLAALGVLVVAPFALRLRAAWWMVVAAAAADVVAALCGARLGAAGSTAAGIAWAALAAGAAIAAITSESAALQRLPAVRVGPVIVAAQAVVPVLLAGVTAGQAFPQSAADRTLLGAGLALLAAGVVLLASSRTIAGLMSAEVPPSAAPAR
jgi:drug/metabolite transporter (DMT)-like permease